MRSFVERPGRRPAEDEEDAITPALRPWALAAQGVFGNQEVLRALRGEPTSIPLDPDRPVCPLSAARPGAEPGAPPDPLAAPPTCEVGPDLGACELPGPALPEVGYPGDVVMVDPDRLADTWVDGLEATEAPARSVGARVRVLHRPWSPLRGVPGSVRDDDLYELLDWGEPARGDVEWLDSISGSAANPLVEPGFDDTTVFVGGRPTPEDVSQGWIGSCWLLAAASAAAAVAPERLAERFVARGDRIVVTLWVPDAVGGWEERAIPVSRTLPALAIDGTPYRLAASGVSVSQEVSGHLFYVDVLGQLGQVVRRDLHEAATWVAYLEKAAASAALGASSYAAIDKGLPEIGLTMLLGPGVSTAPAIVTGASPGWDARLAAVGAGRAAGVLGASGRRAALALPRDGSEPALAALAEAWLASGDDAAWVALRGAARRRLRDSPPPRARRALLTLADVGWVRVPHAYAVLAADLRTPDGQPWSPGLPGPDRRASTVWVRDPYGDAEGREGELRLPLAVVDELFDTLSTHAVAP